MPPTLPADAAGLIPQAPPMRLVTRLLAISGEESLAEGVFAADSPFTESDGSIGHAGLMEMAAQSCALARGYAAAHGDAPKEGFLVGIKNFQMFRAAKAGELLHVRTRRVAELDGFLLADTAVFTPDDAHRPLASLRVKAYCPPEGSYG